MCLCVCLFAYVYTSMQEENQAGIKILRDKKGVGLHGNETNMHWPILAVAPGPHHPHRSCISLDNTLVIP